MIPWLVVAYTLLVLCASLLGGMLPLLVRFTHARMQFAVSFVAGVMLGVGFLHMLPHALRETHDARLTMLWVLVGFLITFFVQRFLLVHQHVTPDEAADAHAHHHGEASQHLCEGHHHPGDHDHDLLAEPFTWSGAAAGLALHSLISGIALAAAYESQRKLHPWAGAATFLAIVIHKPFDALTIITLMTAGGWPKRWCHVANGLFSLAIPVGVLVFYGSWFGLGGDQTRWLGYALSLSAGTFLCIAASDLLPEMQFHSHHRGELSLWLLGGVGLAYLIEYFTG